MRLIDADALIGRFRYPLDIYVSWMIDTTPTADVAPVVRGEWMPHYKTTQDNEDIMAGWECSQCGMWEMEKQPYCHCGARMRGASEQEARG